MIEDRHARKSTIIASQLPVANWFDGMEEMKKVGINFLSTIKKCLSVLKSFDYFYLSGSWDTRQMILGSVFIEKLIFEKNSFRTPGLNSVIESILHISSNFCE
ncbi:MAG: hypothetical protein ACOC4B_01950 [Bacteroidota bacterium]